jgi:TPR repeat protein
MRAIRPVLLSILCALPLHFAHAAESPQAAQKAKVSKSGASAFSRNPALPKWVTPLEALPPTASDEPVVVRLAETQYWTGVNPAYLVNRAVQVNSSARLAELGQFSMSFVPAYQKLVLHKIAIVRGSAEALALMLHTGDGIPINLPEAVRYYEMAVQSGFPRAMNNLANMYEEGQGVAKDSGKTMELYRNAARLGHSIAMLNLAELYENKLPAGAANTRYMTLVYYMLANKYGQADAQAGVQRLSAASDAAVLEKARAYTLAWKPGQALPEES